MADITNSDNIISLSDVTDRVEELRSEREDHDMERAEGEPAYVTERDATGKLTGISINEDGEPQPGTWEAENPEEAEELAKLEKLLSECVGYGGNHKWEGNWYPNSLIADDHFPKYAEEYANDIGAVSSENASWIVIDWDATAEGMKQDFSSVDFDGVKYWYRG